MKETSTFFETFFKEHYASFCFFANRYVKDSLATEAIVSDVALKVWKKKKGLKNPNALKSYFYSAVRNGCLNYIAKEKRKAAKKAQYASSVQLAEPSFVENIIRTETLSTLEVAVHTLPPQCRKVFIKLFFEGKSLAQTAEEMNLTISTIKNQRLRGIKLLRTQMTMVTMIICAVMVCSW
jgi:RNA polymerase sigma-70 factor (ECF subfamily)